MEKRTISAGFIALICYSILYYSGTPVVIQGAAAALCCFCVYELACATEAIRNEALFTLTILGAFLLSFWDAAEEARLLQEYGAGLPIETIAHRHGRSVGAIETRLSELGQRDQIQFSMR